MKTDQEITAFFKELYGYEDPNVEINHNKYNKKLEVKVSQMYEYVPVDFKYLTKIGEFFKTDKIDLHKEEFGGCETCNYGSSYEANFYIDLE